MITPTPTPPPTPPRDTGVATVAVAVLVVLVVAATVVGVGVATATGTRHVAQLAADLAALAGAGRIGVADDACAAAGASAVANGAVLQRCDVTTTGLRSGEVRVVVGRTARWCGLDLDATARARAARLTAGAAPSTRSPP